MECRGVVSRTCCTSRGASNATLTAGVLSNRGDPRGGGLLARAGTRVEPAVEATAATTSGAFNAKSAKTSYDPKYKGFMEGMAAGYFTVGEEAAGYWMQVVQGALPEELEGTYFRNGPGKFEAGSEVYGHPYDGDGLVVSVAMRGGRAFARSRFVQTHELAFERSEGRIAFRGAFATQRSGGPRANAFDVYVKNSSNTSVLCWGDVCLTLFEAAQPYRLDPSTLATQAVDDLQGRVSLGLPFTLGSEAANQAANSGLAALGCGRGVPPELSAVGGDAVTAHPRECSATGRLVMLSYQVAPTLGGQQTTFTFHEFDGAFKLQQAQAYLMSGYAFMHDFAITPNYYILFENPVRVNMARYLLGAAPAASCVEWVEGPATRVHVVPRPCAAPAAAAAGPRVFDAPPRFVFHHANAYEEAAAEGAGADAAVLVVDSIAYSRLPEIWPEGDLADGVDANVSFEARLQRTRINLGSGQASISDRWAQYLEMPETDPRRAGLRHRYVYGYHSRFDEPQVALAKVDVETEHVTTYSRGRGYYLSEPCFVPRPGGQDEDDGWLLATCFNTDRRESELVVLDARDICAGPLAVLRFCSALPHGVHGTWAPRYYGPPLEG